MSRQSALATLVTVLGAMGVVLPAHSQESSPGKLSRREATVDTVAGPGVCASTTLPDEPGSRPGSIATGANGALFVQVGPPAESRIRQADQFGSAVLKTPEAGPPRGNFFLPRSGAIAADGTGGLLVATEAKVLRLPTLQASGLGGPGIGLGFAVEPAAGEPSAPVGLPGGTSSGDGGPALQARFTRIAAIVADPQGNVFIAEQQGTRIKVRFLN
ncbi:MAG: hypothetical protein ACRDIU_04740, partial [Actinomycetota bacterium]